MTTPDQSAETARDPLAAALTAADAEVSIVHDLIHKTGTSLSELDTAIWRVHDIIRPALAASNAEPPTARDADALQQAAVFMLVLVDQYYGTDHEFDIPDEAEFRRHRAVIEGRSS